MPQTRTFEAYGVTSLVVRGDLRTDYGTVGNNALKSALMKPISLVSLDGNYYGGGGEYLQLHDTNLLTAGNVPTLSLLLPAAGPINLPSVFADVAPILFKVGLTIAVSSTAGAYTASASTVDLEGSFEEFELVFPPGVYLKSGDLHSTPSPPQITPWVTASGPQRLQRIIVQEQLGTARFIRVDADDTGVQNTPMLITPLKANGIVQLEFGTSGMVPRVVGADGVLYQGCLISVVDVPTFPFTVTNSSAIIFALYRPFTDTPYY